MPSAPLLDSPQTRIRPFRGPRTTVDQMREMCLGARGERSMLVRSATEYAIRRLQPKDYLSELIAVRNFVAEHVRYANDPTALELVKDPQRMIEEIQAHGVAVGDCDDEALLIATMARQLGRRAEWVTVGFGEMNHFSHIFTRAEEPKTKRFIVLDPVAGTQESRMLARVTTWRAWTID